MKNKLKTHLILYITISLISILFTNNWCSSKEPSAEDTLVKTNEKIHITNVKDNTNNANTTIVKTGLEVLLEDNIELLKGKKVGIVTNPTGVTSGFVPNFIALREKGVNVTSLFAPEHGIYGEKKAGEEVESYNEKQTGLPVYSLYGITHSPSKKMLDEIDVIIYDIQDIGVRSYTYISTMGIVMQAASKYGKEMYVLDRPNPLTGNKIEGPILEKKYESFVGKYPIPYIYGMTCGELAKMIVGEKWLKFKEEFEVNVIPMRGWKRDMVFDDTHLPWVPTSPHIPTAETPAYYAATGILGELETMNIGVGYTMPFQLVGNTWIDGIKLANELNSYKLEGVYFRPIFYQPYYFGYKNKICSGVHIYFTDIYKANLTAVQFYVISAIKKTHENKDLLKNIPKNNINMFHKIVGTDKIEKEWNDNKSVDEIITSWNSDIEDFKKIRDKYLIYKD